MSMKIKRFLQICYPQIREELEHADTITQIKLVGDFVLPEAIVRVVTGQMISGKAAETIYNRIKFSAATKGLCGSWMLDQQTLRKCGLSGAKARAIVDLGSKIGGNSEALDYWHSLTSELLLNEIKKFRGMGVWSAGILALFYIGHEDIFPEGDGSLQRAIQLIQKKESAKSGIEFDVNRAAPYRSYLALYLWHILDAGLLTKIETDTF